jgi:hypothetical protein
MLLLLPIASALAQQGAEDVAAKLTKARETEASIPPLLAKRFLASGLTADYSIAMDINPFYLQGDFDGDGRPDFITMLTLRKSKITSKHVVLFGNGAVRWLSQDIGEAYPGPAWYVVFRMEKIARSPFEDVRRKAPVLRGDAIMTITPESSSALIFWTGKRFAIYWQSD